MVSNTRRATVLSLGQIWKCVRERLPTMLGWGEGGRVELLAFLV